MLKVLPELKTFVDTDRTLANVSFSRSCRHQLTSLVSFGTEETRSELFRTINKQRIDVEVVC